MSETPPSGQNPKRDIKLPAGYDSVYDRERRVTGSPATIGWKMPLLAVVLAILVAFGVGMEIYEAEPLEGWLDLRQIRITSDEGFVYLLVETGGSGDAPPWEDVSYAIAIDTYDRSRGVDQLGDDSAAQLGSGAEFLLAIDGPNRATLRVVEGYDPIGNVPPVASPRDGTDFRNMTLTANRERYARDGSRIPGIVIDRGLLQHGSEDPSANDFSTLADFSAGDGALEIRIPWGLLNVGDPSTRQVLHSNPEAGQPDRHTRTDGFRLYVLARDAQSGTVKDSIPDSGKLAPLYRWTTWEEPAFTIEPKRGLKELKAALDALPDSPEQPRESPPEAADDEEANGLDGTLEE